MKKHLLPLLLAICMLCTALALGATAATPADHAIQFRLAKETVGGTALLRVDFYAKTGADIPSSHMVYLRYDAAKLFPAKAADGTDAGALANNFSVNNAASLTNNNYASSEVMLYTAINGTKGYIGWKVTVPAKTKAFTSFTRLSSVYFGLKGGASFDALSRNVITLSTPAADKSVTAQTCSVSIVVNDTEMLKYGSETAGLNNLTVDESNLLVAGSGVTFEGETTTFIPGDCTGDGKVDKRDLIRLQKYLADWVVDIDLKAADCNGDGNVDKRDLIRLQKYLAGWNVELGK